MKHVLGLLVAALLLLATPATAGPRIVAVGDLHGDHAAFRAILAAARLIDGQGRWTGGDAIFVQTGDVPDRGPDSLRIIRDLMRLQGEAARAGGRVVPLVGNHEAMNITDDLRYVHPGEYAAFVSRDSARRRIRIFDSNRAAIERFYRARDPALTDSAIRRAWFEETPLGKIEHQIAWHPTGEIGRWVIANPAVALIDGNLFVHGGISAGYAARPIAEINQAVAAALTARETGPDSIINDRLGPLWYRGLVTREGEERPAPPSIEEELAAVLAAYGARRIVIGHTPSLAGIVFAHDGRLVRIDSGISAYYSGRRSYLEIVDGAATAHLVP